MILFGLGASCVFNTLAGDLFFGLVLFTVNRYFIPFRCVFSGVFQGLFSTYIQDSSFGELTCQMWMDGSAYFCDTCGIISGRGA
jgi:hypothetical protein